MAFDKQAESIFAKVFGRAPESSEERSFLQSTAQRKQGGALQGALEFAQKQGTFAGSTQGASTSPQAAADPAESALDKARSAIVKSQERIQKANMNLFKKEAQVALKQELLKNPAIQKLMQAESQTDSKVAGFDPGVEGSALVRPTQQGAVKSQDLAAQIQTSGDIGRSFALRGQGISQIINDISAQRQQELESAQTEQASASNLISQLINISGEERNQQLFPLELEQKRLQAQELKAKISEMSTDELDKPIPLEVAAQYGLPQGTTFRQIKGQVLAGPEEEFTEAETRSASFFVRADSSGDIINQNEASLANMNPVGYLIARNLPNMAQSPLIQSQLQAERDFVNAVLRRESGAVINPDEFENARKQYFPQPGDSATTITQKRRNRETALAGLRKSGGAASKSLERELSGNTGETSTGLKYTIEE